MMPFRLPIFVGDMLCKFLIVLYIGLLSLVCIVGATSFICSSALTDDPCTAVIEIALTGTVSLFFVLIDTGSLY